MMRRTTFADRPARGGSTTTTSGRPAFSASSRKASRTSRRRSARARCRSPARCPSRRRRPVRRPRCPRALRPGRRATGRPCRCRCRGRRGAPSPRAPRTRPRRRRAARPSPCSSGRTPPARSRSAARRPRRGCARRPTGASCARRPWSRRARRCASTAGCRTGTASTKLWTSISPGLGHQAHADLPRAAPLADDEVAQQPRVCPAVEGVEAAAPAPRRARPRAPRCRARRRAGSRWTPTISSHEPGAWKPQMSSPDGSVPKEYSSLLR